MPSILAACAAMQQSKGGGESRYQVIDPGDEDTKRANKGSLFCWERENENSRIFFQGNCWLVGFREIVGWLVGFREIVVKFSEKEARLVKLRFHLARLVGVLEILLMATRNPVWKPVEVGSISHYFTWFSRSQVVIAGVLPLTVSTELFGAKIFRLNSWAIPLCWCNRIVVLTKSHFSGQKVGECLNPFFVVWNTLIHSVVLTCLRLLWLNWILKYLLELGFSLQYPAFGARNFHSST